MHLGRILAAVAAVFALAIGARTVRADQCELVTETQAEAAKLVIKAKDRIAFYCEPCGEKTAQSVAVHSIAVAPHRGGFVVAVNGKSIDLAYTYFAVPQGRLRNLAMTAGCPVTGVSEFIDSRLVK
jgi:hypothetical protein